MKHVVLYRVISPSSEAYRDTVLSVKQHKSQKEFPLKLWKKFSTYILVSTITLQRNPNHGVVIPMKKKKKKNQTFLLCWDLKIFNIDKNGAKRADGNRPLHNKLRKKRKKKKNNRQWYTFETWSMIYWINSTSILRKR